jgi:hypothetical protein
LAWRIAVQTFERMVASSDILMPNAGDGRHANLTAS